MAESSSFRATSKLPAFDNIFIYAKRDMGRVEFHGQVADIPFQGFVQVAETMSAHIEGHITEEQKQRILEHIKKLVVD